MEKQQYSRKTFCEHSLQKFLINGDETKKKINK